MADEVENTSFANVHFPAFHFGSPNCVLTIPASYDAFGSASWPTFKRLLQMTSYFLVDSSGRRFDLRSPSFVSQPGKYWMVHSTLLNSKRPIVWNVLRSGQISVDELRRLIKQEFQENESIWQEMVGIESLEANIASATTIAELFAAFE